MALAPIPLSQSAFPASPHISAYDVAFPEVKLTLGGLVARRLGTYFSIANGLYVTAAHLFDVFSTINRELRRRETTGVSSLRRLRKESVD